MSFEFFEMKRTRERNDDNDDRFIVFLLGSVVVPYSTVTNMLVKFLKFRSITDTHD